MPPVAYVLMLTCVVVTTALTWFFYRSDAAFDGQE
jgi:hypothetical protein